MKGKERCRSIRRMAGLVPLSMLISLSLICSMSAVPWYAADDSLAGYSALHRFLIYCVRSFSADVGVVSCLGLGAGVLFTASPG